MYSFGQDKAKVGIVTVIKRQGSYKLRFQYPAYTSHEFAISKITPEGWQEAIRAAQLIDRDCSLNDFDDTYARYSPKHARKLRVSNKPKQANLRLLPSKLVPLSSMKSLVWLVSLLVMNPSLPN